VLIDILIGVAVLLAVLLAILFIVVSRRPGEFRIERSATMAAPPDRVFAQVNDLHNWQAWSPWAKLDPSATETHEGAASGAGAIMSWNGNKKVGAGRMTIVDSKPHEFVRLKLEFFRPMRATNTAEFTFRPANGGTAVHWSMTGVNGFMGKAFCMIVNMDKMIGADFEKGLSGIRSIVETK
jgi:Polyketide cyclase / dehydrase and lipid transport